MHSRSVRVLYGAVIAFISILWVDTRIAMLRTNQDPAHPLALSTFPVFHGMAVGLESGRVGQVDLEAFRRYSGRRDLATVLEPLPRDAAHEWVNYYTLDVGYSFIVEAARLIFPTLPDNELRALALQLIVDAALVLFVGFVFSQWNRWLGLFAAALYVLNVTFCQLVSVAYYYYWDVPLTFIVIGSLSLAYRRQQDRTLWLTLAAVSLGFGVWLRGSWWPLSLFLFAVAVGSPTFRRHLMVPVIAFALVAAPQVVRSSRARGHLAFTTRSVWHVAMVGLGYYPNPYGFTLNDDTIFTLTKTKYGVPYRMEDFVRHEEAARQEFMMLWRTDRPFVVRSFAGRLRESLKGTTEASQPSFTWLSNPLYRLFCLAGVVAMLVRAWEKRLLAIVSSGMYAIYVVLTSAFFYVGLAYDNVSQVTLFFLFIGGVEAVWHATERVLACEDGFQIGL